MTRIKQLLGGSWPPSQSVLRELLDDACVDTYDAEEALAGIGCTIQDEGALPCACVVRGNAGVLLSIEARDTALVGQVELAGVGALPIPLEDVIPTPGEPVAFLAGMYRLWLCIEPAIVVA